MQDALKAALLLSVAHMLVTGASPPDAYTREKFLKNLLKAFTRSDTGTSSTEEGAIDTTPQNKDEALYTWILIASIVVTLAVFICNAVAASKEKDPEKDTKKGLESGACVIAAIVFMYTCKLLSTQNIENKWYQSDGEVLTLSPRGWTLLGVFLYTILTAIAAIVEPR